MKSQRVLLICLLLLTIGVSQSSGGQVNAFIYHRFDENRYPSTSISAEIFEQQLKYLRNHDIEVISLGDVAKRLATGAGLPEHAVSLCVDDAFRSFYDVAMPLLRKYDFPVTLFVNSGAVGETNFPTWKQLRELVEEGVEIGNHTFSHPYLVELQPGETRQEWHERISYDILHAQQQFIRHLGFAPALFVYPYGEFSVDVVEVVKESGFIAAFAQQSGVIHPEHNRFILPRFPMGGPFATLEGFQNKVAMRPLIVDQEVPFEPIIGENPPTLQIRLTDHTVEPDRINCYVQGENQCHVKALTDNGVGWYQVVAEKPLSGRRNKYTLTFQSRSGDWFWYSHPWVKAKNPAQ